MSCVQVVGNLKPHIFKPIGSNNCGWDINIIKRCPEYKGDGKDIGSYFCGNPYSTVLFAYNKTANLIYYFTGMEQENRENNYARITNGVQYFISQNGYKFYVYRN